MPKFNTAVLQSIVKELMESTLVEVNRKPGGFLMTLSRGIHQVECPLTDRDVELPTQDFVDRFVKPNVDVLRQEYLGS